VNEGSARINTKNEKAVGLEADHIKICKFASTEDHNYSRVLKRIEATMIEIQEKRVKEKNVESALSMSLPEIPREQLGSQVSLGERLRALRE